MDATIFFAQIMLSFLAFGFLAWLAWPWLRKQPQSLSWLIAPHLLRYVALIFLVPGLIDPAASREFALWVAIGDLAAVVLAFVALLAIRNRWRIAKACVWAFSVVGIADLLNAYLQASRVQAWAYAPAVSWFIPTFAVPLLLVTHALVVMLLLQRK